MPSDRLFGPSFTTEAMEAVVSDRAWLQAMLDVEAALAAAEARVGIIPTDAARTIAACCKADQFDVGALGREAAAAVNPVIPMVRALTSAAGQEAARFVHWGATSQDILDTAAMIVARSGFALIIDDLEGIAEACAALADAHRSTVMSGRTLLQQAVPITFGLKAAGWLTAIVDARDILVALRHDRLAVQLGGAAGTLASLGPRGIDVLAKLSLELGLSEPVMPWHTARGRVTEVGAALGLVAGVMGKIALDVALLMQTEVAEAQESPTPGGGGSSTMPQKRNPVGATAVLACVRRAHAQVGVLLGAMVQEHERAAGAWQAEWETITDLFRLTAAATAHARQMLDGLEVHPKRMRANFDAGHGLPMAESVMMALAERIGRVQAHDLVEAACVRAVRAGRNLREELLTDPIIRVHLTQSQIDAALDPTGYLGSADAFIERALAAYRRS